MSACAICERLLEPGAVYEDELWQVRSIGAPVGVAGWMTMIARRHVAGPAHMNDAEAASFGPALRYFERTLETVTGALRVYTAALGEAAPHLHVHMVPRAAEGPAGWSLFDRERAAREGEVHIDAAEVDRVLEAYRAALAASTYRARPAAPMATGLGGVFFKTRDPAATRAWYAKMLGIPESPWGHAFTWREREAHDEIGYSVWSPFAADTTYFAPSDAPFMINLRVADLVGLLAKLRAEGVEIAGGPNEEANGKFAWIVDLDGRKLELWEPIPSARDPYLGL